MTEDILITIADVQEHRKIADNFEEKRFDSIALSVQRINLRNLLRPALYKDLLTNIADAKYVELLDGVEYIWNGDLIDYFGLKPFICFHWLALAIMENDVFISDYGTISFDSNPQDDMVKTTLGERRSAKATYLENTVVYANDISRFLNEESNTYPKWDGRDSNKKVTRFNFTHV